MKISIDTGARTLACQNGDLKEVHPLYPAAAFGIISRQRVKLGWDQRFSYTFSWLGRPIIQLPEDMVRAQEILFQVKPDVIIETGVAHGGSLVYYASLCKIIGKGRVIGVDITIREQNRKAIESHFLSPLITLIEGDSTAPATVKRVQDLVKPGETVLVLLDSCHTRDHVRKELEAYQALVSPGSFIVATDGIMRDLHDVPKGQADWVNDHPAQAAQDFLRTHPEFEAIKPEPPFNESSLTTEITHWPDAWLRRKSSPGK